MSSEPIDNSKPCAMDCEPLAKSEECAIEDEDEANTTGPVDEAGKANTTNPRVAEADKSNEQQGATGGDKPAAFVLGYTGASGKAVVAVLDKDDYFGRIVLVGRREAELDIENDGRFEQKVVDFDTIMNYGDVFRGCDVGFCCIGSSQYRHGKAEYKKVDRDYVINTAKVAKETGCKHFILMTSVGADKHSLFYALKIKGQTEEGVRQLGFEKLSIFRPGLIVSKRSEPRFYEGIYRRLLVPVKKMFPTRFSVPAETMARGMLNDAKHVTSPAVAVYDTREFFRLAENKDKK